VESKGGCGTVFPLSPKAQGGHESVLGLGEKSGKKWDCGDEQGEKRGVRGTLNELKDDKNGAGSSQFWTR